METRQELPSGSLIPTLTRTGVPTYRAKWRDSTGKQCAPTIGRAWLVRDGDDLRCDATNVDHGFEHWWYYRVAGDDYAHWSPDLHMHFGYCRRGAWPCRSPVPCGW